MNDKPSCIAYFGYGSLVNLNTLRTPWLAAHPARLSGWERIWLARPKVEGSFAPIDDLAFLSARRNTSSAIDGMLILDHASSLASLDEREALYERHTISSVDLHFHEDAPDLDGMDLYVYAAEPLALGQTSSILRSYLDAVGQGFHTHFGEEGLARFIASTANFDLPIHEDRHDPLYPRPVDLTITERNLMDRLFPVNRQ